MEANVEQKYLWILDSACKAAMRSYDRMPENKGDAAAVIADAQHFLSDVGRISRTLWPTSASNASRGEYLRWVLNVPVDSPMKTRSARNHFEHMDERLDAWAETSADSGLAINIVGSRGDYPQIDDHDLIGFYDPGQDLLIVRGDIYSLKPTYEAVRELDGNLQARIASL